MSSFPTPGTQYTVVVGDNLSSVAGSAYGDPSKWRLIWKANKTRLRSNDPNKIYPGEILTIPTDPDAEGARSELLGADSLSGKDKDEMTLVVEGTEIPLLAGRVTRTMDTMSDGWSGTIAWNPADKETSKLLRPYGYQSAKIYLGGQLVITGRLYDIENEISEAGRRKNLWGFSSTIDIVHSDIKAPYEFKDLTLFEIADKITSDIQIVNETEDTDAFPRATADKMQKQGDFLLQLATQRGILLSSTSDGKLIFWTANTDGATVGTISEGQVPYQELAAKFEGSKRFNAYQAIGRSPGRKKKPKVAIAKDDNVPLSRFMTFQSDETSDADVLQSANWKRSKQFADALSMPFPVSTWYGPDGKLWTENTIVTVQSETLEVPDGFDFLIRSVDFNYEANGTTAMLRLVPPNTYSGEPVEDPWS